jgi:hypothetical protein
MQQRMQRQVELAAGSLKRYALAPHVVYFISLSAS